MNATDLLARFRENQSETAFRELVGRYTNLVYSVAKRRLTNGSMAEEVTQTVFIRLAKAVPKLRGDAELAAWLHRTTVHVSIDLWRSETRRRSREEQAAVMQLEADENIAWEELAPVLDEALNELSDVERQTILLRFFEHKTMRELGAVLGISEDAAKMRVSRALERLRSRLNGRGVTCGAVALSTLLTNRAVEAAPGALVAALMILSLPIPVGVGAGGGFFGALFQVSRAKLLVGLTTAALVGIVTVVAFRTQEHASHLATIYPQLGAGSVETNNQTAVVAATEDTSTAEQDHDPDPLKLLQGVAQARLQFSSGSMEFQLAIEHLGDGRRETNRMALAALFDGHKLRWEQVGREYRYTAMGEAGEAQAARIKEERLTRATAIREGLLQGFEARYVNAYEGAALLTYRETDGRSAGAVIDDPNKGSSQSIFDPRCLGLSHDLSVSSTVENSLGYNEAKSIKLVGKESANGIPAWHVHVRSKHDQSFDFWLDAYQPTRVLKSAYGSKVVVSKYDPLTTSPPIPTEVMTTGNYGSSVMTRRFIRTSARFNDPVDPASFTLAGLGMSIGTIVSDNRIHRSIGYWNGAGLSENQPRKGAEPQIAPNEDMLWDALEND